MGELSKNIEGLGPARQAKLNAAGIYTLDVLRGMNLSNVGNQSSIAVPILRTLQQMARLQLIPVIYRQYAEGLVKSSIPDFKSKMLS